MQNHTHKKNINEMKRFDSTVGNVTTKEKAQKIADSWRNPALGYHTQVIRKNFGYICRIVING